MLVGFGVNLVSGDKQKPIGVGLLLLGALVESVAFVIPRRATDKHAADRRTAPDVAG
ncbi:hypothetical protein Drose_15705 [Dactylosporangium roseum]|uniref:Uncharacterized protein n=1 Tax=Dactylosporangium roseum TaxID=47989 RepID=A0ABY5ZDQ4_9ACTN|nr:hypothetical protein [Dactylosporangium roseum]UWZ39547.1 hypothetical protein Drose_15705 [Dactylosporangium roseum]